MEPILRLHFRQGIRMAGVITAYWCTTPDGLVHHGGRECCTWELCFQHYTYREVTRWPVRCNLGFWL